MVRVTDFGSSGLGFSTGQVIELCSGQQFYTLTVLFCTQGNKQKGIYFKTNLGKCLRGDCARTE